METVNQINGSNGAVPTKPMARIAENDSANIFQETILKR